MKIESHILYCSMIESWSHFFHWYLLYQYMAYVICYQLEIMLCDYYTRFSSVTRIRRIVSCNQDVVPNNSPLCPPPHCFICNEQVIIPYQYSHRVLLTIYLAIKFVIIVMCVQPTSESKHQYGQSLLFVHVGYIYFTYIYQR